VVHGTLLALENYIPKHKTGSEGVIVNISSIAGIKEFPTIPIYAGTKFAVMGMTKSFGDEAHYNRTKVKVLAMCPGVTDTPLISEMGGRNLGPAYQQLLVDEIGDLPSQKWVANSILQAIIITNLF
jgi:15-hydroxyprostaglandin dehydrogenase (NAD)